jgi:heme exporter protein CcmD
VSYVLAAYGVTALTLLGYALLLHRERRRLARRR